MKNKYKSILIVFLISLFTFGTMPVIYAEENYTTQKSESSLLIIQKDFEKTIELDENEEVQIPIDANNLKTREVFNGTAGYVTIKKIASNKISWQITLWVPASNTSTYIKFRDITSGRNAGWDFSTDFSGTFSVPKYKGHSYIIHFDSTAYLGNIQVATSKNIAVSLTIV